MKDGLIHGDRLRALRAATGVHARDVAAEAGCAYRTLQMIECDRQSASLDLIGRVLLVLSRLHGRTISFEEVITFHDEQAAA